MGLNITTKFRGVVFVAVNLLILMSIFLPLSNFNLVYAQTSSTPNYYDICSITTDPNSKSACQACFGNNGIYTALGCIPYDPSAFVANLLTIALGIAGGLALLLMLYGAFTLITSGGDPKRTATAKEIIGGAIGGLLFIIFSVVILKIVGVDILQLPGL